jgi:predicted nucleic acid-binding protein
VIYLDTSVVLAALFNEQRRPPDGFWAAQIISSRLLEFELAVRLNALGATPDARKLATDVLETMQLVELTRPVLARALQPFPVPLRTLDAIHLATLIYLQGRGLTLELATYDKRLADAAIGVGVTLAMI